MSAKRRLVKRRVLSIRTTNPTLRALKQCAAQEGVTASDLANRWIEERVAESIAERAASEADPSDIVTPEARAA